MRAVAQGEGFEFVMTLGTGVGTALFNDGKLLDHLELSHGPFQDSTFDLVLGNAGRKSIGKKKWRKLVLKPSTGSTDVVLRHDLRRWRQRQTSGSVDALPDKAVVVPNSAGITGGVRVWDLAPLTDRSDRHV